MQSTLTSCSTVTTDPNSAIDDMKTLKDKNNTTIPWNREQRGMMETIKKKRRNFLSLLRGGKCRGEPPQLMFDDVKLT